VEQTGTQTIAIFTGTLLKRELVGEQHIIQLVFQEGVERWLCLTSNRAHKNLDVGKQYHIEGAFRHLGSRPYIHEPVIARYLRLPYIIINRKCWALQALHSNNRLLHQLQRSRLLL
jgi:hypothetical protein